MSLADTSRTGRSNRNHADEAGWDKEAALAFQSGDRDAYSKIHDGYSAMVHSICRRMLINPEDASDAAQETFLRVYEGLSTVNGDYRLRPWVARIATNVCLDAIRAQARRPPQRAHDEELALEQPASTGDPEASAIRGWEQGRVHRLLNRLPDHHRAALVLRDIDGLSYRAIAERLGTSESRTKALMHRARRGFRRLWSSSMAPFVFGDWLNLRFRPPADPDRAPVERCADALSEAVRGAVAQTGALGGAPLQHCGLPAFERVASVVTMAVVGAAMTVAAPSQAFGVRPTVPVIRPQDRVADSPSASTATSTSYRSPMREGRGGSKAPPHSAALHDRVFEAGVEVPAASEPQPSTSEATEIQPVEAPPETTVPPSSHISDEAESMDEEEPGPSSPDPTDLAPGPAPVELAFEGDETPPADPSLNEFTVECGAFRLQQEVATSLHYAGHSYPALLTLGTGSSMSFELSVDEDGSRTHYSAGGPLIEYSVSGGLLDLRFRGRFGSTDSEPQTDLPPSGAFEAHIVLDCDHEVPVKESLLLRPD